MHRITVTENISLAYELGSNVSSERQNESLYGVQAGQRVRGQNLKVSVDWRSSGPHSDILSFKSTIKKKLSDWDHSFLNEKKEFSAGMPVTLETLARVLWVHLFEEGLLQLTIEQGSWSVEKSSEMKLDELHLKYKTTFRSVLKAESYLPLDLGLQLCWAGEIGRDGLLAPWSKLKGQISEAQRAMALLDTEIFNTAHVEDFLSRVASLLKQSSASNQDLPQLQGVSFADSKDHWALVFTN